MNNKKRYCSTLKAVLQYLKKRNPVSLEGDNKELKKDAFLVPYSTQLRRAPRELPESDQRVLS